MQSLAITWLGHSAFRLRTPGGKEVLLDPWYTGNPSFPEGARPASADLILVSHGHSDHITDLGDVIITRWITTFTPKPAPLHIIGPPGTAEVVDATLAAFAHDIGYRIRMEHLQARHIYGRSYRPFRLSLAGPGH